MSLTNLQGEKSDYSVSSEFSAALIEGCTELSEALLVKQCSRNCIQHPFPILPLSKSLRITDGGSWNRMTDGGSGGFEPRGSLQCDGHPLSHMMQQDLNQPPKDNPHPLQSA